MRRVFREPPPHGLRVYGRCLAGQVAVQQEIETLVFDAHVLITGQSPPNPQKGIGGRRAGGGGRGATVSL